LTKQGARLSIAPFFFVNLTMNVDIIKYLENFLSERRKNLISSIVKHRTKYITVVLEDIFQSQNASAVLRTCDCFGIQDIHIIENNNKYQINPDVALGSNKWLSLTKYNAGENNSLQALHFIKELGYRIVATTPHKGSVELEKFDLDKGKIALFFGTELKGLSKEIINNADEFIRIPMFGFTESFNISVSAAIILHHLTYKLRNSLINWKLTDEEENVIKYEWLKNSIKNSDKIEKVFISKNI
jgi:tRNA (guanosine-2'-O-)-methyltransferase